MEDYFGLAAGKKADRLADRMNNMHKSQVISLDHFNGDDKNLPQEAIQNMSENMIDSSSYSPPLQGDTMVDKTEAVLPPKAKFIPGYIDEKTQVITFADRSTKKHLSSKIRKL